MKTRLTIEDVTAHDLALMNILLDSPILATQLKGLKHRKELLRIFIRTFGGEDAIGYYFKE